MSSNYTVNNISVFAKTATILGYLGTSDPPGWIICDGQLRTASDSRYSNLVALNSLIGGSGTANSYTPPDYRGAFIRGSNLGTANTATTTFSGVNYGANAPTLGSKQKHATEVHNHTASADIQSDNHAHNATTGNQSHDHTHNYTTGNQSHDHTHPGKDTGTQSANHSHSYKDAYFSEGPGTEDAPLSSFGHRGSDHDNKMVYRNNSSGLSDYNPNDQAPTNISTTYQYAPDSVTGNSDENNDVHAHSFTTNNQTVDHTHNYTANNPPNANHTHSSNTTSIQSTDHTHTITISSSTKNTSTETRPYNVGVNWIIKL